MNKTLLYIVIAVSVVAILFNLPAEDPSPNTIRVAVASNFSGTLKEIVERYEQHSANTVTVIVGSSGKLYAQIKNGAPYDIFLSADKQRPLLLEQNGLTVAGSRFTYALGKLLLWSPQKGYLDSTAKVLRQNNFNHIAMANPKLAPYGRAAKEVLIKLDLWDRLQGKIAYGENISQTFNFVQSANAQLGFIAYTQFLTLDKQEQGSFWEVPQNLHTPIEQQVVLLNDKDSAVNFFKYLQSEQARKIISENGYILP